eukprot:1153378-Pelagomonas_calceolata.AAC.1
MLSISPHNGQRAESIPEGGAASIVGNLRQWVVSFRTHTRSISRAELASLMHVCFKLVCQACELVSWSSVGVVWFTVAFMRGLQRKPVKIVEGIPDIWKCNVLCVHECYSMCAGVSPLITNNARICFIKNVQGAGSARGLQAAALAGSCTYIATKLALKLVLILSRDYGEAPSRGVPENALVCSSTRPDIPGSG